MENRESKLKCIHTLHVPTLKIESKIAAHYACTVELENVWKKRNRKPSEIKTNLYKWPANHKNRKRDAR